MSSPIESFLVFISFIFLGGKGPPQGGVECMEVNFLSLQWLPSISFFPLTPKQGSLEESWKGASDCAY